VSDLELQISGFEVIRKKNEYGKQGVEHGK
jgi:hypothetical protein